MRRLVLPCLAILLLALVVVAIRGGDSSRPAHHQPAVVAIDPATDPIGLADAATVAGYVHAVQAQQVSDYLHAANDAAVAAYVASLPPIPAPAPARTAPAPAPVVASPAPGGGACGGATNGADQFIQRESGGNPNAYNPSGAWGCYQIMPGTWAGAGCDDLGAYGSAGPSAQAACASRLSLSAWNL